MTWQEGTGGGAKAEVKIKNKIQQQRALSSEELKVRNRAGGRTTSSVDAALATLFGRGAVGRDGCERKRITKGRKASGEKGGGRCLAATVKGERRKKCKLTKCRHHR